VDNTNSNDDHDDDVLYVIGTNMLSDLGLPTFVELLDK